MAAALETVELNLDDELLTLKNYLEKRKHRVDEYVQEGKALLKIRKSFKSDEKFGKKLKEIGVTGTQQSRNNSMHIAEFFDGKDTSQISVLCAREISKPKYRDIAEEAYLQAVGNDLSTVEIKNLLEGLLKNFRVKEGLDVEDKPAYPTISEKYPTKFKFDKNKLASVETGQLAIFYRQVDLQAPLVKGLILLELRKRFPSNLEFNKEIKKHKLNMDIQQKRTLFMNLAHFFENRSMEGIPLTVAYEISSPSNGDIAESLYEEALGKNLSVKQIKKLVQQKKGVLTSDGTVVDSTVVKQKVEIKKSLIDEFIGLAQQDYSSRHELIAFFKSCLEAVKKLPEEDVIEGEVSSTDKSVDGHG
jgi:hypothetical protein